MPDALLLKCWRFSVVDLLLLALQGEVLLGMRLTRCAAFPALVSILSQSYRDRSSLASCPFLEQLATMKDQGACQCLHIVLVVACACECVLFACDRPNVAPLHSRTFISAHSAQYVSHLQVSNA